MAPSREPDVTFSFDANRAASRQARIALRPLLTDDSDPLRSAVTLAASELVSNVVKHTAGGGILRVWDPKPDVPIRVEVEDFDPSPPRMLVPQSHEITGRGLQLVGTLAERWGYEPLPAGKLVWAEFNRNHHTPPT